MNRYRRNRRPPRPGAALGILLLVLASFTVGVLATQNRLADAIFEESVPAGQAVQLPPADNWRLVLVNPWNRLPEGFSVELTPLINGQSIDSRCLPDLQSMMDDCRAAGLSPLICSSYRSREDQEALFAGKVGRLVSDGLAPAMAETEAAKSVALPGTSEHELGLAVDIVALEDQNLDSEQEKTEVQKWLMEHSWEYGFILRYPADKTKITGIIYEPWHYRYVGREAAEEIYSQGLCLEEYLDSRSS